MSLTLRFVLFIVFCLPLSVIAEKSETFGNYTVHYSAFTTDVLTPAIAKTYNIKRSKNRAMINISVLKKVMGTTGSPVKAEINGTATNLNQQLRELEIRELNEGGAIYYIAITKISNDENITFDLSILPEGEKEPYLLSFKQNFYTN